MTLETAEKELNEQIKGMGFKSIIIHQKFDKEPAPIRPGVFIRARTIVMLIDQDLWKNTNPKERKSLIPLCAGIAHCSVKDQFNRKKGRVTALGRAIRAIKYSPILKNYPLSKGQFVSFDGSGPSVYSHNVDGPPEFEYQLEDLKK